MCTGADSSQYTRALLRSKIIFKEQQYELLSTLVKRCGEAEGMRIMIDEGSSCLLRGGGREEDYDLDEIIV